MTKDFNVSVSMNQAAPVKTGMVLKQGDFGFDLKITVMDFTVTGTTPQIVFRKPMGAVESTDVTSSGNVYTYTFKGTELDTPGKVFCDLKLKNSTTQRISTASFQFECIADTLDGLAEESSSYSDTIAQIASTLQGYSEDSEAWAKGTKNGTPVSNTDPQYQNNAKYYSDLASGAIGDLIPTIEAMGESVTDLHDTVDASVPVNEITSFENFLPGSISFSGSGAMTYNSDTANAKCIVLYNVDFIKVKTKGYKLYLKQIPTSTGTPGETVTIQNNTYESTTKAHYVITAATNISGTLLSIITHNYNSEEKGTYENKEFYNTAFKYITDYSNTDYMEFDSSIRCLTKKIYSNRIYIKCNDGYLVDIYSFRNNIFGIHTSNKTETTVYNQDVVYFVVVAKKSDNSSITAEEAERNIIINSINLNSEPQVIYFTTNVPINGTNHVDHGILVLPANYNDDGTPIRLCIVCHGAGASKYDAENSVMDETGKILGDPQRVLTKKGYAVMDCFAAPYDYVGETTTSLGLHFGNPSVVTCYQKAYEYVVNNFNVKKDGILLFASSMGGLSLSQIVHSSGIPILSAVGYCPCLDMFKQAWCNTWKTNQRYNISRLFGFEGTAPSWTNGWDNLTEDEKQYFYDNIDKVIGYYPILNGTTKGSFDELKAVMPADRSGSAPEEKAVYDTFRASYEVPFMIIHCTNDTTMASRYSEYYIDMLRRNGQLAKIKEYATGGHSAWAAGDTVTTKDIFNNDFTCKESQMDGFNFAIQFDR